MRVVIVGAGPGGLFAAERCALHGHEVTVFDQRRSPARKLVLAGRGGLNITHSEALERFLDRYGPERERLQAAIRGFTPRDLERWVAELGEDPFVGSSGRVFPASFRAVPLLRHWLERLDELGVRLELGHHWLGWSGAPADRTMRFIDNNQVEKAVEYDAAVLALGGASWPRVGSDGSWVATLRSVGVEVVDLAAANCGVQLTWSAVMLERFAGVPVKNAAVIVEGVTVRGDPIVTTTGLEGGPIYAHSRRIREAIEHEGAAKLELDLLPDLNLRAIERRLAEQHRAKRSLSTWLVRSGVSPVGVALMREATSNSLPTNVEELATLVKAVPFSIVRTGSIERAISSAGGVAWAAVDDSLQLTAVPGTHVIGEMLDWEAPTGGYLLQAVFSTAHLVAEHLGER